MQKGVIPLELFRLLGTIAVENKEANDALKDTANKGEKAEGSLSKSFLKIGKSALKIGTAMGAAALAAGAALKNIADETREYRTEMGKLDAAYMSAGHSAETAKKTYSSLAAVLGDTGQAVEASTHLAKLVKDEKDLATWTDICTGVYATFGASLPIEGLTEAANETAKTGQLTGSLADSLNWAGVSETEFQASLDACTTEQERQALITSTLNGLYADASKKYKEVNADVLAANEASGRYQEGMAAIGAVVEPIISKLTYMAGTVLLHVANAMQKVITKGTALISKFKEIKDKGVQLFTDFKTGVVDAVNNIVDRVNAIISAVQRAISAMKELFSLEAAQERAAEAAETRNARENGGKVNVSKHAAGGILTKPTIFGYTPATNTYHLGGEAGAEAIAPIDVLQGYVRSAVADGMKSAGNDKATGLLEQMVELLQISANNNTRIEINGREFGRMVKEYA